MNAACGCRDSERDEEDETSKREHDVDCRWLSEDEVGCWGRLDVGRNGGSTSRKCADKRRETRSRVNLRGNKGEERVGKVGREGREC